MKKIASDTLSKNEIGYIMKFIFDGQKTLLLGSKLEGIYKRIKNCDSSDILIQLIKSYGEDDPKKYLKYKQLLKKQFFRKPYTKKK